MVTRETKEVYRHKDLTQDTKVNWLREVNLAVKLKPSNASPGSDSILQNHSVKKKNQNCKILETKERD